MKKIILVPFLIILNNLFSQPDAMYQWLQNGDIIQWVYAGGDEFEGTELDYNIWWDAYPWHRNVTGAYYSPGSDNLKVENGLLKIITKYEPGYHKAQGWLPDNYVLEDGIPNLRFYNYTSGLIYSLQGYKYGLFDIVCKMPEGKGLWPAFWLYGEQSEEFDIFEAKGERPDEIHIDVHCNNGCDNYYPNGVVTEFGGWAKLSSGSFTNEFHAIVGEWEPGYCLWYHGINEFAVWWGDFYYRQHVIANTNVAVDGGPFSPGPDASTPLTSVFEIDAIRIWNRINCQDNINLVNYDQTISDPTVITGGIINIGKKTDTNSKSKLESGEYLQLIATDDIIIDEDFEIDFNSHFSTKIVECPSPFKSINNNLVIDFSDNESKEKLNLIKDSEIPQKSLFSKIYNNSNEQNITIEFEGELLNGINIELLNSENKILFSQSNIQNKKIIINTSNFASGIYYLNCSRKNQRMIEKIIISK